MPAKEARRNQAVAEVDRFTSEFASWKQMQQDQRVKQSGDPRRQYDSQIEALSKEVTAAATILREHLTGNIDVAGPAGDVYRECAATEQEILWLWRVWDFFREKFDQRLDDNLSPTLRAADEVVWSCYRPFFRKLSNGRVPEPAPLPYIEADFSPSALRRDRKEVLARRGPDFKLTLDAFRALPIPILKIPVTAISNPWSLVLVGHETGHIIQPMIAADFTGRFTTAVSKAVPDEDADRWRDWSPEVFADWYGVVTMGQWILWAMAQFEIADRATMLERRDAYPAPLVRLKLLAALAEGYGLPAGAVLDDLGLCLDVNPGDPPEAQRDYQSAGAVAAAILAIPELRELLNPLQFSADKYAMSRNGGQKGEVEQWSDYLAGGPMPASKNVRSARMAAAGLAHRWNEKVIRPDGAPSEDDLQTLRAEACSAIAGAAEPSVRAAVAGGDTGKPPGRTLLGILAPGRYRID